MGVYTSSAKTANRPTQAVLIGDRCGLAVDQEMTEQLRGKMRSRTGA